LTRLIAGDTATAKRALFAEITAEALLDVLRVRAARRAIIANKASDDDERPGAGLKADDFALLLSLERYERRALSKRRMAVLYLDENCSQFYY
jgi:hypothetical protein